MIYDNIKNCKNYMLDDKFELAFTFLECCDGLPCGKHDIGLGVFANIMEFETKPLEDTTIEAHKKYIDIQYIASGVEKMGYSLRYSEISGEYDKTRDIYFVKADCEYVTLTHGDFAVFFPTDYHRPSIGDGSKVKKVVVKVPY